MTDDHVRVQFAAYYVFQQCRQQRVYMGLTHLEGQPLVEGVSEQESVDEAGVHPRHADRAASAYDGYALTQGLADAAFRSEEHTSEFQSRPHLVCRLLLEKKKIPHPTTAHLDLDGPDPELVDLPLPVPQC